MKQVRFFNIEDGAFNYLGRVILKDGKIKFDGLPNGLKDNLKKGLVRWIRPRKKFLPKDGLEFLKMIPETFRGSYLNARAVEDVDE
tara:strand:+ start:1066 stop:1323 length:258 start_codon:yes stop_codon:yes gene_type:complete